MEKHCTACHNADKHKGGVDLSGFTDNLSVVKDRKLWHKVLEQIESGDMPPDDEPAIAGDIKPLLLKNVREIIDHFEVNDPAFRDPGPSLLRRLTRVEYENSIRALLGIEFDAGLEAGIVTEDNGRSYANLAVGLTLPPSLMEKYFASADRALERLFMTAEERKQYAARNYRTKMFAQGDEKAAKAFFAGLPQQVDSASIIPGEALKSWLQAFLRKAYRRPLAADETSRLIALYERSSRAGDAPMLALRKTLKPVLVSPEFLYRIEADRAPSGSGDAASVSDVELASRLSYFLWSAPPDEALLAVAEAGTLSKPEERVAQTRRLLSSERARALTQNFASHWLQVNLIKDARPQQETYPLFNQNLRDDMQEEILTFMDKLRELDLPVLDMLSADYAYVNEPLAQLYGLPAVKGRNLQKVSLPADSPRGGLLGMGGVLTLTSHSNRTSPTLRGKYVLEVVLGTPPPLPPNNVSQLAPPKKGEPPKTIREQLAQHAQQSSCAACHKRIDPLGFAMENFDGIGGWRDSTPEVKLDTDGTLPNGEKFNGVRELKQVIKGRQSQFIRNMVEQTLVYALGRELDYYDEGPIQAIEARLKAHEYRFSELILGVVESYPFQYR
ncbi:MAG TPA: DUF1592 domain-containing protein, partial [Verrucomicrobium sp.]|nr:DUF1592 domain-containing protein [Verrucomicrobium sp.]